MKIRPSGCEDSMNIRTIHVLMILLLVIILPGLQSSCAGRLNNVDQSLENTRILFQREHVRDELRNELFIVDQDGNNLQWLGVVSGPAKWSNSGTYFATGCFEDDYGPRKICIFDARTIPNYREYVAEYHNLRPDIIQEMDLPKECKEIGADTADLSGIMSLSWSPDDESIAIVCTGLVDDSRQSHVCILPLGGETTCWDESKSKGVFQVEWSPTDNKIATGGFVDQESIIQLVGPDGENATFLTHGWGPEWSPDGQRIAYLTYSDIVVDDIYRQAAIAVVNTDGTGMRWLYNSGPSGRLFLEGCANFGAICNLAWSPDGTYLSFVGGKLSLSNHHLISMNVETGEMKTLIQSQVIGNFLMYPDWSTIEPY